jgi:tetratricopeptide (TPR) repeat protein
MDTETPKTATPAASLQATSATEVSADNSVAMSAQLRVVLLPPEARAWRRLVGCIIVLGAAWMAKVLVSPVLADYLAGAAAGIPALEGALAWHPTNPELRLRLARAYDGTSAAADTDQARHQIEAALRLRPTSALTWLTLAQLNDGMGQRQRAQQALATALRLDPQNVNLRWEAALLALRWGERETALEQLRLVLAVHPAQADAAFQLASALLGPEESSTSLLPSEPEPLLVLLRLAMRNADLPLARAAWERPAARGNFGARSSRRASAAPQTIWSGMAASSASACAAGDLTGRSGRPGASRCASTNLPRPAGNNRYASPSTAFRPWILLEFPSASPSKLAASTTCEPWPNPRISPRSQG